VIIWQETMLRAYQAAADHENVVVQEHLSVEVQLIDAEEL